MTIEMDTQAADRANSKIAAVPIKFETRYIPDPKEPGKFIGVDWVTWVKRGDQFQSSTCERIDKIGGNTVKGRAPAEYWPAIETKYKAWKAGQEEPVSGFPLSAWQGFPVDLLAPLAALHIKSVEDLASTTDGTISRANIPMLRQWVDNAIAQVAAQKRASEFDAQMKDRDAEVAELKRQIAAMAAPQPQQPAQPVPQPQQPRRAG